MAEMVQNPLDDYGFLDAGDHPQLPAALAAGLNVDSEYPLEALPMTSPDGYRFQLVARLEPESPNPLVHRAKKTNAHANKKYADLFV
jgi:hypothetical protein